MGKNFVDQELSRIAEILRHLRGYLEGGDAPWDRDAKTCEHIQRFLLGEINEMANWQACCRIETGEVSTTGQYLKDIGV